MAGILGVRVTGVRTQVVRGDLRRVGQFWGKQRSWKKAVVTLAPGEEVEFFEALDDLGELDIPEE